MIRLNLFKRFLIKTLSKNKTEIIFSFFCKNIDGPYKYSKYYDDAVELFFRAADEIEKKLDGMEILHLAHLFEMLDIILNEQKKASYHAGFAAGKKSSEES